MLGLDGLVWRFGLAGCVTLPHVQPLSTHYQLFFVLGLDGLVWKFGLAGCVTLPRVQSLSAHTKRHSPAGAQPTSSRQAAHNDPQGDRVQGHCVILHNRPGSMCQPI